MRRLIFTMTFLLLPFALDAAVFRAVVIPVEFSDVSFKDKQAGVFYKTSTATSYFNDQFSPTRTFSFTVLNTVRLPHGYAWYGVNSSSVKDLYIGQLVREAVEKSGTNLSSYDNDADGAVDLVYIITAGSSESDGAGADHIWPRQGRLSERGEVFSYSGKTIDSFAVCTESSSPGVFCHEFAHIFGLMDMYDTDGSGSGGTAKGLWGTLSLMDNGISASSDRLPPNFCAVELDQLGLGTRIPFTTGAFRLRPLSVRKEYMRIDTGTEGEYYLLECRKAEGWDAGIGGGGLVIYHIDRSENNSWYSDLYVRNLSARERWEFNQVNCRPERSCAQVVSAIPGATNVGGVFFPQPGRTVFASDTDPSFRFWDGSASQYAVDNIVLDAEGNAYFNLIAPISVLATHVFQDAVIFNWVTAAELDIKDCYISWHKSSDKSASIIGSSTSSRQDDGLFSCLIENLEPSTTYKIRIRGRSSNGHIYSSEIDLGTKGVQKGVRPFIYLNSLNRRDDGSFYIGDRVPMRVYNLSDAKEVLWYFNGVRMRPESDGYWHLTQSGTLKAEIWYSDGTVEIITRKMTVR
ncbi:MAG: M6 family metalloprotease domain-containing protein [Bacteroidales bacterium]|nr:M6 family metalloprotease domain-containing protein [Bacteroidales bacterium]